jgi:hypothetical protein
LLALVQFKGFEQLFEGLGGGGIAVAFLQSPDVDMAKIAGAPI